jgi:hypothetical protein
MKFNYAKLPYKTAQEFGLDKNRYRDKNGNVIVNQSDLISVGTAGETLSEKVKRLGGVMLSNAEALKLIEDNRILIKYNYE